jgi:hypothetical protein
MPVTEVRLSGHFVYGGDQTYEQALATRTALLGATRRWMATR